MAGAGAVRGSFGAVLLLFTLGLEYTSDELRTNLRANRRIGLLDLALAGMVLSKNGDIISTSTGAAVQGSPDMLTASTGVWHQGAAAQTNSPSCQAHRRGAATRPAISAKTAIGMIAAPRWARLRSDV